MKDKMIWAYFMGVSHHMWTDGNRNSFVRWYMPTDTYEEENKVDLNTWDETVKFIAERKYNMLVVDLGDGVLYDSHPEISAPDAWSKDFLKQKLNEARALGLEVIPKLNFSTAHDTWMKDYRRMISTPAYYKLCSDLIAEVCELFDYPRLFHVGLDEENEKNQIGHEMVIIRGENLYWHDAHFLFNECEKHGARPWVWSDYYWNFPDQFEKHMPTSVLQSNWYYGTFMDFDKSREEYRAIKTYEDLERLGYDQIPTCASYKRKQNAYQTVAHGQKHISEEHLLGFMSVPWMPIREEEAIFLKYDSDQLYRARQKLYPKTLE